MALMNKRKNDVRGRNAQYDDFHETLAPTAQPMYRNTAEPRVYREIGQVERPTALSGLINLVGTILSLLLALRILMGLVNPDQSNSLIASLYNVTDWLVRPLASLIGLQSFSNGRYLDWAAVATLAVVSLLTYALSRLFARRASIVE